jgi:hypothetical protein
MKIRIVVGLVTFGILLGLCPVSFAALGSVVGWGWNAYG